MNNSPFSLSRRGFSLIELIVVIAIIAVIAGYVVPQASQILKGSTLTQGSTIVTDQIRLAREYAVTKNCKVEVRFYQYADPEVPGEIPGTPTTGQYRAMQIFQVMIATQGTGVNTIAAERCLPLDKVQLLPQGVIMEVYAANSTSQYGVACSTILTNPNSLPIQGSQEPTGLLLPRGINSNYNYVSFRFLQDGSTNLAPVVGTGLAAPPWFLTLHNMNDTGYLRTGMPYNYFCLEIDPVVGTTKQFRPQAG
jgi:uncharacterized protein (TIGR02596 family)